MARRPDRLPDPQDIVSGKVRVRIEQLFALIHEVNPTDKGLPARERATRYALKSRLQGVLVRNHADVLEVVPHPTDPAVVSFRHRQADRDAAHAVLAELDDDTRRWAETQLLLAKLPDRPVEALKLTLPAFERPTPRTLDALARGRAAVEAWDYDAAREAFTEAVAASRGGADAARALLDLLVNTLADDVAALAVEHLLSTRAVEDREVRGMLALAAARSGDRERARRLGRDSGTAELQALLAGLAVRDGDAAEAQVVLARLRDIDAAHPAVVQISDGIQRLKADERRPAEAELAVAVAAGDDAVVERLAVAMLARWPTSEPARQALTGLEGRRRSGEAQRLAGEAWAAWSRGDAVQAGGLARRARTLGVDDPEMAAWLSEAEAAAAEVTENVAIRSAVEDVRCDRLDSYLGLSVDARSQVREQVGRPLLAWIETLGRTPEAVAAAVALEAALQSPSDALAQLRPHDRLLRSLPEGRRALAAWEAEAGQAAKRGFADQLGVAEDAYLRGDLERALALVNALDSRAATPAGLARQKELLAALTSDRATLAARRRVEDRVLSGDLLGARDLARALGLDDLAASLATRVRTEWRVRPFREAPLLDAFWPEDDPYPRVSLSADARQICIGEAHHGEVFVRVIDRASMTVERALRLRTPTPMDWRADQLIDGRLYIIGDRGSVLVIDVATFEIASWHPDVLVARPAGEEVELATMSPGGRYLWLTVRTGLGRAECRVYDLESWPRFRKMEVPGRPFPLWGAPDPTVALLQPGLGLRLHTPSGNPRMQRTILTDIPVTRVTAHPTCLGVIGFASAAGMRQPRVASVLASMPDPTPDPLAIFVCHIDKSTFSAKALSSTRKAEPHSLATSFATEQVWMRICVKDTVEFGPYEFQPDGEMDSVGGQAAPRNAVLLQDASGQHVAAMYCTPDGMADQPLAVEPAQYDEAGATLAHLTVTPHLAGALNIDGCGADRTWISDGATALARDLAKVEAAKRKDWISELQRSFVGDPVALADLVGALSRVGLQPLAEEVLAELEQSAPDSAQARAFKGVRELSLRNFEGANRLLGDLNVGLLPPRMAQHVRHARVILAVEAGDFEVAGAELAATPDLFDGCDLRGLRALVAVQRGQPQPEQTEDAIRWRQVSDCLSAYATADALLARSDWDGAWAALNQSVLWRIMELEPLSRQTTAVLGRGKPGFMEELAVASFLQKWTERETLLGMGGGHRSGIEDGYAALFVRGRAWLESVTSGGA